jgi:DNA helicase-2/ATP-dependent DNA helicase PcrA
VLVEDLLSGMNPEQREAVLATEGPVLVLAGAGSGKTRVLTHRIAYLIGHCGIAPEAILAVTFTNKAAGEMRERVNKLLGQGGAGAWLATFHSTCVRILRSEIGHLGRSRGFVVYDESDSLSLVQESMRRHGLDPKGPDARSLRWRIDQWKNAGDLPAAAAEKASDIEARQAAEIYATYQRLLAEANALDFGDLLLLTVDLFDRFPNVLRHYQERWQYLLIDEYQDTNRVQYRLVKQLAALHGNVCVVGDPQQCLPAAALVATPRGERRIGLLRSGDRVLTGAGWGATRIAPVEKALRRRYRGRLARITTKGGRTLDATPNHLCFARIEPQRGMHYVYLMWKRGVGFRLGVTSGVRATSDGAIVNGIEVRTNQELADATWIVWAGRDAAEARFREQFLAARYGLPTLVFRVRGRRMAPDPAWVNKLFAEIDTESAAERLMGDFHLDRRFAHHRPNAVVRGGLARRIVWFTMFGDGRRSEHRVQFNTSGDDLRARATTQFPVRDGKQGTWRIETSRKSYEDALELAEGITHLDDIELITRARLTKQAAFTLMPASHLREGMVVPVREPGGEIGEDEVASVDAVDGSRDVFDLSIPGQRNFVANGIVVHNSIYGWRGADVNNILDFERDNPGARTVKLVRNYRSSQEILSGAGAVVEKNRGSPLQLIAERGKGERIVLYEARDERDEGQYVVRRILEEVRDGGRKYGDCAVFYRTNAQSRPIEEELLKYDVPYVVVGGVRFYDRAEVKDVLCYLRAVVNPADAAALARIANRPARGIGDTTLERARELARTRGVSFEEGLRLFAASDAAGRARPKLAAFLELLDALRREVAHLAPADAIAAALKRSGYLLALERENTPEAESRVENLRELVASAEDFSADSAEIADAARTPLERFLDQVALVSDLDSAEMRSDRVSLMTVHSAKGLEFPVVFVAGLEEGVFPHQAAARDGRDVEEERRLCYVAMTRAMERLTLSYARERRRYGQHSYGSPSRFLREIPQKLLDFRGGAALERVPERAAPERDRAPTGRHYDYSYDQGGSDGDSAGDAGVRRGTRVRHPIFGAGAVLEVIGRGPAQKLRIQFDRAGVKTVLVRYANLELG